MCEKDLQRKENSLRLKYLPAIVMFEVLGHDRAILAPLDDSVCREIAGRIRMIRRARGYVPGPLEMAADRGMAVFAAGGDLKASFCYAKDGKVYMSQYFGDLEDAKAYEIWESNIERLGRLLDISPAEYISDQVIRPSSPTTESGQDK